MSQKPVLHARDHLPGGADPLRIVFPTSQYSNAIINNPEGGLVLYWKLDELGTSTTAAVDSSGNGQDGVYGVDGAAVVDPTAHPTLGVAGLADGTAARFDGVNDNVVIGDPGATLTGLTGFGVMSVECWAETTTAGSLAFNALPTIIGADTSSANGRFFNVTIDPGGGTNYVVFNTAGTGFLATGSIVINDGARHHIVCTFDATDMRIYVDGVLDVTHTPSMAGHPLADHLHALSVGGGCPNGGGFINANIAGTVDEVALYTSVLALDTIQTQFLLGQASSGAAGATGATGPAGPSGVGATGATGAAASTSLGLIIALGGSE